MDSSYKCNGEQKDINNRQRKARLEHRARLLDIVIKIASTRRNAGIQMSAIHVRDSSQYNHCSNEGTNKAQIHDGDEDGVVSCTEITNHREELPGQGERGDYEEDEDVVGGELVGDDVLVDEPGEHADYWDGDDHLDDAPGQEEEAGDRHCGVVLVLE